MGTQQLDKALVAAKVELLQNLYTIQESLGAYNSREGNDTIRGTGLRGDVSASQALLGWSRTAKGIATIQAQAKERNIDYIIHLAQSRNRWTAQEAAAKKDIKLFEAKETELQRALSDMDSNHPILKTMSLEDLRAELSGDSEASTSSPGTRLADEQSTQSENDALVEELARRAS